MGCKSLTMLPLISSGLKMKNIDTWPKNEKHWYGGNSWQRGRNLPFLINPPFVKIPITEKTWTPLQQSVIRDASLHSLTDKNNYKNVLKVN